MDAPRREFGLPARGSGLNVLLGVTGSVASIRRGVLYESLLALPTVSNVTILCTEKGAYFEADPPLPSSALVLSEKDEWGWNTLGDPVLHIELRRWADAFIIAPLSANTLAKLGNGICDNALTCVARAWEMGSRPLIVAPAMNTAMWNHPHTASHLSTLRTLHITIVDPVVKTLACGDTGVGAMAPAYAICRALEADFDQASAGR